MADETEREWYNFLDLMLSTWSADEMAYMHTVQREAIEKESPDSP